MNRIGPLLVLVSSIAALALVVSLQPRAYKCICDDDLTGDSLCILDRTHVADPEKDWADIVQAVKEGRFRHE